MVHRITDALLTLFVTFGYAGIAMAINGIPAPADALEHTVPRGVG